MYPNARSRSFTRSSRHAVQTTSPALELANDFTVSAWYRATRLDTDGSEIVSGWNGYIVRLRANEVEFVKRVGGSNFVHVPGARSPGLGRTLAPRGGGGQPGARASSCTSTGSRSAR